MIRKFFICLLLFATARAVIKIKSPLNDSLKKTELPVSKLVGTQGLTICSQVFVEHIQEKITFFSEETNQIKFEIRFNDNYGFFYLNGSKLIFQIPGDTFHPFAWFHICFTIDSNQYAVVSEGKLWYHFKRPLFKSISNEIFLKNLLFGLTNGIQVSELNIWSQYFHPDTIIEITKACTANFPVVPDILDWSQVSADLMKPNDLNQVIEEDPANICHSSPYHKDKIIPIR